MNAKCLGCTEAGSLFPSGRIVGSIVWNGRMISNCRVEPNVYSAPDYRRVLRLSREPDENPHPSRTLACDALLNPLIGIGMLAASLIECSHLDRH